jgi:protein-disulfide isomerase
MPLNRRSLAKLSLTALVLQGGGIGLLSRAQADDENVLSRRLMLRDPEIPASGNPDGDVTIIEYLDYQCPYCRKIHPVLESLAREDAKLRLVYKNWPILGDASIYAAQMALAAREQGKYAQAHEALISLTSKLTTTVTDTTLAKAGVDVERARGVLVKDVAAIGAVLKRNAAQAKGLDFQGTPGFIVGKFRVPGPLAADQFKMAIADARKALASEPKRDEL